MRAEFDEESSNLGDAKNSAACSPDRQKHSSSPLDTHGVNEECWSCQGLQTEINRLKAENDSLAQQLQKSDRNFQSVVHERNLDIECLKEKYDELKSEMQATLWHLIPSIEPGKCFADFGTEDHAVYETAVRIGDYDLGDFLFPNVRRCVRISTNDCFSIKIIKKNEILSFSNFMRVKKEVSTLRKVKHPNIIKLIDIINSSQCIYLITEVARSDLFDFLETSSGTINEAIIREIFLGILLAVNYLHSSGIAHRDLKPENILLMKGSSGHGLGVINHQSIRICDFGSCADNIIPGIPSLSDLCGSPGFFAPEMLLKHTNYDGAAADVWSLGCIALELLRGHEDFYTVWLPSYSHNFLQDERLFQGSIANAVYTVKENLSSPSNMNDLLRKILVINPEERLDSKSILLHPWLGNKSSTDAAVNDKEGLRMKLNQSPRKTRRRYRGCVNTHTKKPFLVFSEDMTPLAVTSSKECGQTPELRQFEIPLPPAEPRTPSFRSSGKRKSVVGASPHKFSNAQVTLAAQHQAMQRLSIKDITFYDGTGII